MLSTVYLVDDERIILEDLVRSIPWLENGFQVIGYNTNPLVAFAEIVEKKPDVVFTDLKMPVIDGIELVRRIKDANVGAEFIMLSAFEDFTACHDFFALRGLDYIVKPLNEDNAALVLEQLSRELAAKNHQQPSTQFEASQSQSFDDLIAYVNEHFNQNHTLAGLGERFHMNPTYICDLFAKQYESTLTIFVTNLRMKEASRLMLETDTAFKEIAIHCGYPNYQYFCKVFKQHFGKSPSGYREDSE
ncbi:MAG: response regulator [Oscillospiraceae bacterium]|jgi:YesN/AraC family two-component response regulator|nr:response regulator [Oscillospiraceae bacterium]